MIFAGFLGQDNSPVAPAAAVAPSSAALAPVAPAPAAATGLVTPSAATRNPFKRPVQATPNFVPHSIPTGFIPEFEPFPTIMLPQFPRMPVGIRNPLASEPQAGGVPTASGSPLPADPSGQSSIPAGVPSPVKMPSARMLPPALVMALGIMPSVRGVRTGRVNPSALVAGGRKPGML